MSHHQSHQMSNSNPSAFDILDSPSNFFSSDRYWDERYSTKENAERPYEWFLSMSDIRRNADTFKHLFELDKTQSKILDLGCGNSMLPFDLLEDGWKE
jgi:hypothetical protein